MRRLATLLTGALILPALLTAPSAGAGALAGGGTTVNLFPLQSRPGQTVTVTETVQGYVQGFPIGAVVDWGDGTVTHDDPPACGATAPPERFLGFEETHPYSTPGTFVVTARSSGRQCPAGTVVVSAGGPTLYATVSPTAPPPAATLRARLDHPRAHVHDTVTLAPVVRVPSGEVGTVTVHWGDGTTTVRGGPPACYPPAPFRAPPSSYSGQQHHRYARPGTYRVRVDVTTGAGCGVPAVRSHLQQTLTERITRRVG